MPYTKLLEAMNEKTNNEHNKLMKLDNSMVMYGIYNARDVREINQNCTQNS